MSLIGIIASSRLTTPQPHLTDLRMWYDANDNTTLTVSGSPSRVSAITSKASGYTHTLSQATGGKQPEVVTNYQNGLQALKLTAARNDNLNTNSATPMNGATAHTTFVACKTNSTTNGYKFFFGNDVLYGLPLFYQLNNKNYYETGTGSSAVSSTSNFNGVAVVGMIKHTGTSVTMITSTATDETNTATAAGNLDVGNAQTGIGRDASGTADVHIFEILVYNSILDATATAKTKDYLKTKWGI
jgi:hypothetical protein